MRELALDRCPTSRRMRATSVTCNLQTKRSLTLSTPFLQRPCNRRSTRSGFLSCCRFPLACARPCFFTIGNCRKYSTDTHSRWRHVHQVQPRLRAAAPQQQQQGTNTVAQGGGAGVTQPGNEVTEPANGAKQPIATSAHSSEHADVKGSVGGGKTWFSHLLPSSNPLRRLRRAPSPPSPPDALGVSSPYSGLSGPQPSSLLRTQPLAMHTCTHKPRAILHVAHAHAYAFLPCTCDSSCMQMCTHVPAPLE